MPGKRSSDQGSGFIAGCQKCIPSLNRSSEKNGRVETAKLDALVNLVGELIINMPRVELKQFKKKIWKLRWSSWSG